MSKPDLKAISKVNEGPMPSTPPEPPRPPPQMAAEGGLRSPRNPDMAKALRIVKGIARMPAGLPCSAHPAADVEVGLSAWERRGGVRAAGAGV